MATISEMRLYLMSKYPNSLKWQERVSKMHTRQVIAIYKKWTTQEIVEGARKNGLLPEDTSYHQINMFEYLASLNQTRTEVNV